MKAVLITLLTVALIALTWLTLGWMAILVVPSIALFALMTFAPLLTTWAQGEEPGNADPSLKNYSTSC